MMAKTARAGAGATPPLCSLPEEIIFWEILVRLSPKSLLRCSAVCRAWRRVTSTRDFLVAHHGRQPSLPVVRRYGWNGRHYYQSFFTFNHAQLQHVLRLDELDKILCLEGSCDGLFIHSVGDSQYFVRNPATNQYARIHEADGFYLLGMYHHGPTGEYRLLMYWFKSMVYGYFESGVRDGSYVLTLGSRHPPRHIECPEAEEVIFHGASLMFRGGLHWHLWGMDSVNNMIMVFDTMAESFRQMPSPVDKCATLFEMDRMLAMYIYSDTTANIDIWVLQDYRSEVWAFKGRVDLPVAEIRAQFQMFCDYKDVVVTTSSDGDVLVMFRYGEWLVQVDMDGKLVASFDAKGFKPTIHRLKQTLIPHNFFPTL